MLIKFALLLLSFSALADLTELEDISYGTHPRNKLDFSRVKNQKKMPLMVFIHGGDFVGGDKSHYSNS
jgi:acetyl esterase/lipase